MFVPLLCLYIFFQIAHGQQLALSCKCGGKYANGRMVTGCVDEKCGGNHTAGTRCVVIYQEKLAIGYDCVPWPTHVADCATLDDGSRVCANDVCRPVLLGGQKGDCAMVDDDASHAILAAQVSKLGLDFAMDAVKRQVELEVSKVKIPNQKTSGGGFDITVQDITIAQFVSPTFSYVLLPPSSGKIVAKGGDFNVCAKWDAKMGFVNPGGDICVWSEYHKGLELELNVAVNVGSKGQLRLDTSNCRFHMPIDMKLSGAVGTVINVVSGLIENYVQKQVSSQVCKLIDQTVRTTLAAILDALPTQFKVDDRYGVTYKFRQVVVSDAGVKAHFAANATFTDTAA